jgi:micrococcal nuclease
VRSALIVALATALFLAILGSASLAVAWTGRVVRVADGDTITVLKESSSSKEQVKVRFYGIDCPERKQDFGAKAKAFTSDMVFGQLVAVEDMDRDRYGRTVGLVSIHGMSLNEELISEGLAWVYPRYCEAYFCESWVEIEKKARRLNRGLWSLSSPIPPWEFRKKR